MVTSNKASDKKVVKMSVNNNSSVIPQRTLLGEVNEHLTCPLCRGYYIDATTIVECLHSFCRSCIIKHLQVKSYCPECEMMINSAKPNIKPDKALQDIVYKLVPGLFQKEMERRQQFYASRPGPAASATPEQRGEDTERIIFSPEDVISFSLEYADVTDSDSISSKSSDSNEAQPAPGAARRYLQCPAVVNISHLKKFISMKFEIDCAQYSIDVLYKRVSLPDYYTLMDIAYIYNWKRNEPMRFFYQIRDFIAIRTRYGLFDINRKGSNFRDQKASPTPTEDTNSDSPSLNPHDSGGEVGKTADGTTPGENLKNEQMLSNNDVKELMKDSEQKNSNTAKKPDDEVEKSQFLNSFELTAKNSSIKPLIIKLNRESNLDQNDKSNKIVASVSSDNNMFKRKLQSPPGSPDSKKSKPEQENKISVPSVVNPVNQGNKKLEVPEKNVEAEKHNKTSLTMPPPPSSVASSLLHQKEIKYQQPHSKQPIPDATPLKRPIPSMQHSPKRKPIESQPVPGVAKTVSPLKLQIPKTESNVNVKPSDGARQNIKKIPDLKPGVPPHSSLKSSHVGMVRMDLLANNSDPTIDRSKILSQVKTSLSTSQNTPQVSGDSLKSLFDSCKINIPSSLSITLTDQKLEARGQTDDVPTDSKKGMVNRNLSLAGGNSSGMHKVPSPPVHNYIEILKLPDSEGKPSEGRVSKSDGNLQLKASSGKSDNSPSGPKAPVKNPDTPSAKGPIPSLKPIADTKLAKQNLAAQNASSLPITFQQTFEQQLQSIQTDKSKLPRNKMQVPKLMPATPKAISAANKLNNKPAISGSQGSDTKLVRSDNALDLSTPHSVQTHLGLNQTKAFETMQSIANLAKKQNLPVKPMSVSQAFAGIQNRPTNISSAAHNRPSNAPKGTSLSKNDKPAMSTPTSKQDTSAKQGPNKQPNTEMYQMASHSSPNPGTMPHRAQTRSPSSSPKLVIAEEKQNSSTTPEHNQSNQVSSTQVNNAPKTESPKHVTPGPSKPPVPKALKTFSNTTKLSNVRQPMPSMKPTPNALANAADYVSQSQIMHQHAMLRHHMELQTAWLKAQRFMSNIPHQTQNEFNKKDGA